MNIPSPAVLAEPISAALNLLISSGAGREILTDAEIARSHVRVTGMAPADMLAWLHSPRPAAATAMR